ncbi:hypothetical protein [Comamonas guangdongensis]|uniref:Uncharacterized protein n=1 Tax=Comamonas guangdongensis TaxID=510515 RepID=A0ABV3ZST8_9BURK
MWIEIDDSVSENMESANLRQCAVIESIALSVFHGKHVFYAKNKTLNWLCKQDIGGVSKSIFKKVSSRLSELGSIRPNIGVRLILIFESDVFKYEDGEWIISFSFFESNQIQMGCLLAENLDDANIYLLAAKHYKINSKLKTLDINLTALGAGGSQILPSFEDAINEKNYFCLAITDTDKDYPGANSNIVSRRCNAVAQQRVWIAEHLDVPARELENVLPLGLIADAINSDAGAVDLHERLNAVKIRIGDDLEPFLYCDLKLGTKFKLIKDADQNKSAYWKEFVRRKNISNLMCGDECGDNCSCQMISPLSETIANIFLEFCKKITINKQYERVKVSENSTQWLAIGKTVFDWGVALPKARY